MLQVKDIFPSFSLSDQLGQTVTNADLSGHWSVVYFYPKDDTPGCTTEACGLRDAMGDFSAQNIAVFGVSADSVASHQAFAEKYHLPFRLLADTTKTLIKAAGAAGIPFIKRISYVIDPAGNVAAVYPKVTPASHASELLADILQLQSGQK